MNTKSKLTEDFKSKNEERSQETPNITETLEPLEGAEDKREALGL